MPMSGSRLLQFDENVSRTNKLRSRCCARWAWGGPGALKKEEPHPRLRLCFDGKCDRGGTSHMSVRPQLAAVAAVSALAATWAETSSDENLVKQIAVGSKPAMQALFARHRTYVYRWLLRFVSNETLAEDLLSEVFSMCGVRRVASNAGPLFRRG